MAKVYKVKVGNINLCWYAGDKDYDNIKEILGVSEPTEQDKDLVFGANRPRPIRLRINTADGTYYRFCDPEKAEAIVKDQTLKGKKIKVNGEEKEIKSASFPR